MLLSGELLAPPEISKKNHRKTNSLAKNAQELLDDIPEIVPKTQGSSQHK